MKVLKMIVVSRELRFEKLDLPGIFVANGTHADFLCANAFDESRSVEVENRTRSIEGSVNRVGPVDDRVKLIINATDGAEQWKREGNHVSNQQKISELMLVAHSL